MARGGTAYGADGTITIGTSVDMYGMNTGLKKIQKTMSKLKFALGAALGLGGTFGFGALSKAALNAASDLQEVQNIVDVSFGEMSDMVEKFAATSVEKFGMSELAAKQTAGSFMAMGKALGLSMEDAAKMSISLTALTGDMSSFYNISQDYARVALSAVYTGETETLKRYGIVLTEANLQEYASTLGIKTKVKAMDASTKAILRYKYILEATKDITGDFVRTEGTWANQVRVLQQRWNQLLITMGSGLITIFTPMIKALNALIERTIYFANVLGAVLGKIFGIQWQDFTEQMSQLSNAEADISGGLDDAGDAAEKAGKKVKKTLAPWDELTDLMKNTADTGEDVAVSFEIPDIGSLIGDFSGKLFDFDIPNIQSLFHLGKWFSEMISDFLENIDWETIREKAKKLGQDIADFLNGLINPRLFSDLGATLAQGLNTLMEIMNGFITRFSWANLGQSIAAGINSFFKTFDFTLLAQNINNFLNGLLDMMLQLVEKLDWGLIGNRIGYLLLSIDWLKIVSKALKVLYKTLSGITKAWQKSFDKAPLETIIASLVVFKGLLKLSIVKNFISGISDLNKQFGLFSDAVNLSDKQFNGLLRTVGGSNSLFGSVLSGVRAFSTNGGNLFQNLGAGITAFSTSLSPVIKTLGSLAAGLTEFFVVKNLFSELLEQTHDFDGNITSLIGVIGELGLAIGIAAGAFTLLLGFPEGIIAAGVVAAIAAFTGFIEFLNDINLDNLSNGIHDMLTQPGGVPIEDLVDEVAGNIGSIGDEFKAIADKSDELDRAEQNVADVVDEIKEMQLKLEAGVLSAEEAVPKLVELYGKLGDAIITKLGAAEDVLLQAWGEGGSITTAFEKAGISGEEARDKIVNSFSDQEKRVNDLVTAINYWKEVNPNNPQLPILEEQLMRIATETDEVKNAQNALDTYMSGNPINWQAFLNEDGFDTEKFFSSMQGLQDKTKETTGLIEDETQKAVNLMKQYVDDPELLDRIEKTLPDALDIMKGDVSSQVEQVTNIMQDEMVGGITTTLTQAEEDWSKMSWWEKLFLYGNDFDTFAAEKVDNYKKQYIDPLNDGLEKWYEQLGIDGNVYASKAGEEIIKGLFTPVQETIADPLSGTSHTVTVSKLKDNWKELGADLVDGTIEGLKDKNNDLTGQVSTTMGNTVDAAKDTLDSHSPSKVYFEIGEDMIQGSINGVESKGDELTKAVATVVNNATREFTKLESNNSVLGKFNTMINTMTKKVETSGREVLNNVTNISRDVTVKFNELLTGASNKFNDFSYTLKTKLQTLASDFSSNFISNITHIIDVFVNSNVSNASNTFTSLWRNAASAVKELFETLGVSISTIISSAINGIMNTVVDGINEILDKVEDALNSILSIGNAISNLPSMPEFNFESYSIPGLAKGAVIPPNKQFLAMLGDQRSGTNIEAPLDTIKQALAETLNGMNFNNNNQDIVVQIDGYEVFRAVRNQNEMFRNTTGYSEL